MLQYLVHPLCSELQPYQLQMMTHAWSNYAKYAWGSNELSPENLVPTPGIFHGTKIGLTIVDSLDTLWMMGMFDEVEKGKKWLVENLPKKLNTVRVMPLTRIYIDISY